MTDTQEPNIVDEDEVLPTEDIQNSYISLRYQDIENFFSYKSDLNFITYVLDIISQTQLDSDSSNSDVERSKTGQSTKDQNTKFQRPKHIYIGYKPGSYDHEGIEFTLSSGECLVTSEFVNMFVYESTEYPGEKYTIYCFDDGTFLLFDNKNGSFYRLCLEEGLENSKYYENFSTNYFLDYNVEDVPYPTSAEEDDVIEQELIEGENKDNLSESIKKINTGEIETSLANDREK